VQNYVKECLYLLYAQKVKPIAAEKLQIELFIYPPDKKRRDLDNICKVILDTLQKAGIYDDDFKIWKLTISRKEVRQYGEVEFIIKSLDKLSDT
jgi:crossover junction endodeoxyribonuclease RusA